MIRFPSVALLLLPGLAVLGGCADRQPADPSRQAAAAAAGEVFVGAGDIASCSNNNDEATATLLDQIPGTVFTVGDNVYPDGTASQFANCYGPTWGRHKARTRPSPGNHDYHTSGASAYFDYFGASAGPAGRGYYSYDLGDWHIISLNSNIGMSAGSAQEQWLRADLAANSRQCTLAYWHHARFSSGSHGSSTASQPLWQALYDHYADVVMVGHDHNYQRFAPQTPAGVAAPERGIRQFVVGTGGASRYTFGTPIANTEAYSTDTYGVLKLTLHSGGYDWEFIPIAGQTFRDSGSAPCVTAPPAPVASVTVSPASVSVAVGGTQQFTATLKDADGNVLSGRPVDWASSDPAFASVSAIGLATALVVGTTTITATSEGKSGTAALTVTPRPTTRRAVINGWDSRTLTTLVEDGRLALVTASDNAWIDVEAGHVVSLRFRGIPPDSTVRAVKLRVEHHVESGFSAGAMLWQVGGGPLTAPFVAMETQPTAREGPEREAVVEWDVTPWVRTAARVNNLKLSVRNLDPLGRKVRIDRAELRVTFGPTPPPPVADFAITLFATNGWDQKNGRTLVADGRLGLVTRSDNLWGEVQPGSFTSYKFQRMPTNGAVQAVSLHVEHYEEEQISDGSLQWQAAGGPLADPSPLASLVPAVLAGPAAEAGVAWDVSGAINTAGRVNDLKFVVRNGATNGNKAKNDQVSAKVRYRDP